MKAKKIWANFAVENLERSTKFYTQLGFKSNGDQTSKELTSFFFGEDDFIIHFFLKNIIESNTKTKFCSAHQANEIMFTLSAQSKEQVNSWAEDVESAGGKIISKPEEFGKGYYGFIFADPDGHRFNVFHM